MAESELSKKLTSTIRKVDKFVQVGMKFVEAGKTALEALEELKDVGGNKPEPPES